MRHLDQLDKVPAGVIQYRHADRAGINRVLGEDDTAVGQPFDFGIQILNLKGMGRDPVLHQACL